MRSAGRAGRPVAGDLDAEGAGGGEAVGVEGDGVAAEVGGEGLGGAEGEAAGGELARRG